MIRLFVGAGSVGGVLLRDGIWRLRWGCCRVEGGWGLCALIGTICTVWSEWLGLDGSA